MIRQGDCRLLLPEYAGKVPLIVADPPYNIGEPYEGGDSMEPGAFLQFCREWFCLAEEALSENGSLWIIVPPELAARFIVMRHTTAASGRAVRLRLVNQVIWHYRFGPHMSSRFIPSHVQCLWFCRENEKPLFNFNAVMEASDRSTRYNDMRTVLKSRTPSGMRPPFDVWEIPRVTGNSKERVPDCPNQLPERLVSRIIAACSNPGDLVLDPFAGSGTVPSVALRMGRQGVGIELGAKTSSTAIARIERDKGLPIALVTENSGDGPANADGQ